MEESQGEGCMGIHVPHQWLQPCSSSMAYGHVPHSWLRPCPSPMATAMSLMHPRLRPCPSCTHGYGPDHDHLVIVPVPASSTNINIIPLLCASWQHICSQCVSYEWYAKYHFYYTSAHTNHITGHLFSLKSLVN